MNFQVREIVVPNLIYEGLWADQIRSRVYSGYLPNTISEIQPS